MNSANFEKELLLAEKLSRDYLSSLKNLPSQSPLLARNLVLDIFAEKRQFIRRFQDVIDTGFSNEPGKHWAKALCADHDWGFQAAATDVISSFDDRWQSSNLLFITRIMQAAGSWCGYLPATSWEERIEEYKLRLIPKGSSNTENKNNPGSKTLQRDSKSTQAVSSRIETFNKRWATNPHRPSPSLSSSNSVTSNKVIRTQSDSSGLAFAGVGIFILVSMFALLSNTQNGSVTSSSGTTGSQGNEQLQAERSSLESRLGSYRDLLNNARLKCELSSVESSLKNLTTEASSAGQDDLAQQANSLIAESSNKLKFLDQKGKWGDYSEDCSIGVGYQQFDNYTWEYGSDFRGSLFLVAKRECTSPSVIVKTYDAKTSQELHSQVVGFTPSIENGSQNVGYSVPSNVLPNGGSIRNDVAPYKCN